METNKRRVISLLVDNQSGVLARVSSLFCRRGFRKSAFPPWRNSAEQSAGRTGFV